MENSNLVYFDVSGMDGNFGMIIIQLSGGLGNQLFQYALYFSLKQEGKEVKLDTVTASEYEHKRPIQLRELGISYDVATRQEIERYLDCSKNFFTRIRRKIAGSHGCVVSEQGMNFEEKFLEMDNKYFQGYFQSERYFKKYSEKLKNVLNLNEVVLSQESRDFLAQIENTQSIGIHVRRGDYLQKEFCGNYGGICTEEYYDAAIKYIRNTVVAPIFFVFSNDSEWCKEHYKSDDFVIVDCNDEEKGYMDLILMSRCKHNIIANSSFSWWASWLNKNEEKIIIAPSKWINTQECKDVWSQDMRIKIDGQGNLLQ